MSKFGKKALCRSISLALATPVVFSLLPTQVAQAAVEEIIVTARKTDENVQQVPTAITALTTADLQDLQINNFGQVGQTVPNLNIQAQFGSASAPQFFMRGISSGTLKFQADSGIGLYIDGVYLGRPAGTAFDLADIASVEVLRGPQGSLFGRNSTGGAINIITAEPTGEFGGHAEVGFGNYGAKRQKVTLNLPEYMGFLTRITVLHSETDGWAKNTAYHEYQFPKPFGNQKTASRYGMEDTDAVSLAVDYDGVENLKLAYRFDYTDKGSTQAPVQQIGTYNGGIGFLNTFFGVSNIPSSNTKRQTSVAEDFLSESHLRIQGHSLTAQYDFSDSFGIKNILAFRKMDENVGLNDIDGGAMTSASGNPFALLSSTQDRNQDQWSNELQFFGSTDAVDWITGLFYFRETGRDDNPVFIAAEFAPGVYVPGTTNNSAFGLPSDYFAGSLGTVENISKGVFAHGTWHVNDEFDLAAGVRYTKDNRMENVSRAGLVGQFTPAFKSEADFENVDWDVAATYKITPDLNVYGKASTGYLSGGTLNGIKFDAETIMSYEVGFKGQFFDNILRLNLATFRNDRKHFQLLGFGTSTGTFITDGGEVTEKGVELELTAVPIEALTLTANIGHVEQDFANGVRSLAPENNAYLAAQYEVFRFSNASHIDFRIDGSWTDEHNQLPCPVGLSPSPAGCGGAATTPPDNRQLEKDAKSDASWLIGARLSLAAIPLGSDMKGRVSVWGKNLTNSDKVEFARDLGNSTVVGTFQTPRTYGVDFSVDF